MRVIFEGTPEEIKKILLATENSKKYEKDDGKCKMVPKPD